MKENFTEINNGLEQFTIETCEDIEEFKREIHPYYKKLLDKGYSHFQIQNIVFSSMLGLKIDIEFDKDKYIK